MSFETDPIIISKACQWMERGIGCHFANTIAQSHCLAWGIAVRWKQAAVALSGDQGAFRPAEPALLTFSTSPDSRLIWPISHLARAGLSAMVTHGCARGNKG